MLQHSTINLFQAPAFPDYELIDSGNGEKLERFGEFTLARPEPQALWNKKLSDDKWQELAAAWFRRDNLNPDKGNWHTLKKTPPYWLMKYQEGALFLQLKISLSSFKHVGLFPEQSANWHWIFENTKKLKGDTPRVLNLFAYTGAASLAAKAAGADVFHVDSVKQVVSWARDNQEFSKLDNIRWVVEDAMKFAQREQRRGNKFQGIILDPPAYGRGPNGEKWLLEEGLPKLLEVCAQLFDAKNGFFLINLYSLGFSALIVDNLIKQYFGQVPNPEFGELFIPENSGRKLPLGTFYRFSSVK